jgi:D-amino-acid dehydrogenase
MRQAVLRFDPELWLWGTQHLFLRTGGSYRRLLEAKVKLVRYSQPLLHEIAREIAFTGLQSGVLYLYRDAGALEDAAAYAEKMRGHGFAVEPLDRAQVARREPALDVSRLAGALHAPGDEAGDAAAFCRTLAGKCRALGVAFELENEIDAIVPEHLRVREVLTARGPVRADAFVCALGVMDRRLREQLGTHVPVYPVTGFSATLPVVRAEAAPRGAAIDESRGVAYAPMGKDLRIAGGAEYAGYAREVTSFDLAPLYDTVKQLFPGAVDYARARVRACRRPMTPETTPRFGVGRYQNLWFNIGLGHMGFALAAGAARITADLVCGHNPAIDLDGLRIRRH